MSRDVIPLTIPDVSQFAKSLRAGLTDPPSHVETLSLVARAAGFRNFQHLRAVLQAQPVVEIDRRKMARALAHFDEQGRLVRWPGRTQIQKLCLWVVWAALPARQSMTERDVSARIDACCTFRDAAQIRRAMVEHKMVSRTLDGSDYLRIEQEPPAEARALFDQVFRGTSPGI